VVLIKCKGAKYVFAVSTLLLCSPEAHAQHTIDRSGNIWSTRPANFTPQVSTDTGGLKNCQGAVVSGACINYSIENASGDGLTVQATGAIVKNPKILKASVNGIVVNGTGCIIDGGIINGANGVGILVTGTGNIIKNVTIVNCREPIVIHGVGNIVDWSTIHNTLDSWAATQAASNTTSSANGFPARNFVPPPNIQTFGTLRSPSTSVQVLNPNVGNWTQPSRPASWSAVQGKLLKTSTQPQGLRAKQQTLQSLGN
jgi:hypothetical protein